MSLLTVAETRKKKQLKSRRRQQTMDELSKEREVSFEQFKCPCFVRDFKWALKIKESEHFTHHARVGTCSGDWCCSAASKSCNLWCPRSWMSCERSASLSWKVESPGLLEKQSRPGGRNSTLSALRWFDIKESVPSSLLPFNGWWVLVTTSTFVKAFPMAVFNCRTLLVQRASFSTCVVGASPKSLKKRELLLQEASFSFSSGFGKLLDHEILGSFFSVFERLLERETADSWRFMDS